jgi:hypothetical protein
MSAKRRRKTEEEDIARELFSDCDSEELTSYDSDSYSNHDQDETQRDDTQWTDSTHT